MDEGDHVGVLLNGAGLAQVAEHGTVVVLALNSGARELGECYHRNIQFLGQGFEAAGDGRDFLGAILIIPLADEGTVAVISCR